MGLADYTPAPVVRIVGDQVFASSRDVAAYFEKLHRHVLRDIDAIISQMEPASKIGRWFTPTTYLGGGGANGATRTLRAYEMTRDGFTLLAMGFTGEKALAFKLRYIAAFNDLEAALAAPTPPRQVADHEALLATCREVRLTHGRKAAQQFWRKSALTGLYDPSDLSLPRANQSDETIDIIREFIEAECVVTGRTDDVLRNRTLTDRLREWINLAGYPEMSAGQASKGLARLSRIYRDETTGARFAGFKRSFTHYRGIRLR